MNRLGPDGSGASAASSGRRSASPRSGGWSRPRAAPRLLRIEPRDGRAVHREQSVTRGEASAASGETAWITSRPATPE